MLRETQSRHQYCSRYFNEIPQQHSKKRKRSRRAKKAGNPKSKKSLHAQLVRCQENTKKARERSRRVKNNS